VPDSPFGFVHLAYALHELRRPKRSFSNSEAQRSAETVALRRIAAVLGVPKLQASYRIQVGGGSVSLDGRAAALGVFVLPALVILALFLATLPVLLLMHSRDNMFHQLRPQASSPINGLFVLIFLLPEALLGLALLLVTWVAYSKSHTTLTERRLIFRTGLFARVTGELPLENVEAIILVEPVLGRIFGYGTVAVTSVGGLQFPLRYLASPQVFHATLQKAAAGCWDCRCCSRARHFNRSKTTSKRCCWRAW